MTSGQSVNLPTREGRLHSHLVQHWDPKRFPPFQEDLPRSPHLPHLHPCMQGWPFPLKPAGQRLINHQVFRVGVRVDCSGNDQDLSIGAPLLLRPRKVNPSQVQVQVTLVQELPLLLHRTIELLILICKQWEIRRKVLDMMVLF